MPHIIIEHSDNIAPQPIIAIAKEIKKIMAAITEGNFDPDQCKMRSMSYANYQVGNYEDRATFIHVSIKILSQRPLEIRQKLADQVYNMVYESYQKLKKHESRCDISVDIIEMQRETYRKITIIN